MSISLTFIDIMILCSFNVTGHQLVNWYLSELNDKAYLNEFLSGSDLKILAVQFCTHLLAAGVLRQIPDKNVEISNIFKVRLLKQQLVLSCLHK